MRHGKAGRGGGEEMAAVEHDALLGAGQTGCRAF
jgi:hypothetical protein